MSQASAVLSTAAPAAAADHRSVAVYFGVLTLATGLGDPGGLVGLPIQFLLKDQLGCAPQALAVFEAVTFLPVCLGFLFGFVRDRWRPLGLGDRGYLLLAAPLAALCYLWPVVGRIDYAHLLAAMLVAAVAFQFLDTAIEARMTAAAQRHLMTGRLTALTETLEVVPSMAAVLAGGWMAANISAQATLVAAAACAMAIALLAAWRPPAVFPRRETSADAPERPRAGAIRRQRTFMLTVLVLVLWNFSPGWGTPLFYRLTDSIELSAPAVGLYRCVHLGAIALAGFVYVVLCRRVPLSRLLRWAVAVNVLPGVLLLIMDGPVQAIALASVLGLVSGFANVAFFDLMRRSCPRGSEGAGTALAFSAFAVAGVAGDLVGAGLYEHGGFVTCLVIDASVTILIFPVLRLLPPGATSARDGEGDESAEAPCA